MVVVWPMQMLLANHQHVSIYHGYNGYSMVILIDLCDMTTVWSSTRGQCAFPRANSQPQRARFQHEGLLKHGWQSRVGRWRGRCGVTAFGQMHLARPWEEPKPPLFVLVTLMLLFLWHLHGIYVTYDIYATVINSINLDMYWSFHMY